MIDYAVSILVLMRELYSGAWTLFSWAWIKIRLLSSIIKILNLISSVFNYSFWSYWKTTWRVETPSYGKYNISWYLASLSRIPTVPSFSKKPHHSSLLYIAVIDFIWSFFIYMTYLGIPWPIQQQITPSSSAVTNFLPIAFKAITVALCPARIICGGYATPDASVAACLEFYKSNYYTRRFESICCASEPF